MEKQWMFRVSFNMQSVRYCSGRAEPELGCREALMQVVL